MIRELVKKCPLRLLSKSARFVILSARTCRIRAADGEVTVNEIITMVHIALGTADASTCPHGIPSGRAVDVTLIVQAVGYDLTSCPTT